LALKSIPRIDEEAAMLVAMLVVVGAAGVHAAERLAWGRWGIEKRNTFRNRKEMPERIISIPSMKTRTFNLLIKTVRPAGQLRKT